MRQVVLALLVGVGVLALVMVVRIPAVVLITVLEVLLLSDGGGTLRDRRLGSSLFLRATAGRFLVRESVRGSGGANPREARKAELRDTFVERNVSYSLSESGLGGVEGVWDILSGGCVDVSPVTTRGGRDWGMSEGSAVVVGCEGRGGCVVVFVLVVVCVVVLVCAEGRRAWAYVRGEGGAVVLLVVAPLVSPAEADVVPLVVVVRSPASAVVLVTVLGVLVLVRGRGGTVRRVVLTLVVLVRGLPSAVVLITLLGVLVLLRGREVGGSTVRLVVLVFVVVVVSRVIVRG